MNIITRAARAMFGSANERELKRYQQRVPAINALEPEMRKLSDGQLRAKTAEFRARLAQGETLDDLLCEAFAVGREASRRVMGMRHFDVQLIGGMVLHDGKIAEMRTGEGKTLVGTLPVYLNALAGRGVHVVTVNDYLARRDAGEMSRLYEFLGLSTGVIAPSLSDEERRAAYAADITYGTNNEFGFDYLRDNMKYSPEEMVQRDFNFVIVDEVDSILIDEARTPLIISGPAEDSSPLYHQIDVVVRELVQDAETYEKDEKLKSVTLSEKGTENLELLLRGAGLLGKGSLYDMHNVAIVHHAQQSLRAHTLFSRDVDYIVRNGQVILIDEFTGRMMDGRRYSEGLHQALEAKEGVEIQRENQTLASITFQNYFRLYPKLAGMTGTAMTEVDEFMEIYKLHAVAIPTNLPVQRRDADDEVYLTASRKYEAVANLIEEITARKQPVLVGTTSIEKSEILSGILSKRKIPHNVLNARNHEQEARIIAQAGAPGAITIATNMAGRGTDIKLGGNAEMLVAQRIADLAKGRDDGAVSEEEALAVKKAIQEQVSRDQKIVQEAGGLYVIGTERHESRRVDNQLRGRSGRQGDPGNSRFFLSLEDDLIRIFGTGRMGGMMQKLGLKEDEAIVHPWLNKALEKAQKKVEARNFDMRKNTLRYDDVMNDQRKEVYAQRRKYMAMTDLSGVMEEAAHAVIEDEVHAHIPENSFPEAWDMEGLRERIQSIFVLDLPLGDWASEDHIDEEGITERILARVMERHREKMGALEPGFQNMVEKHILLTCFDTGWKEHLHALDQLRQGIGLRAYAQKDPLNEYKQEAFQLFTIMISEMRQSLWRALSTFQPMMRERVGSGHFHMEAEGEAQGLSSDGSGHAAPLTIGFQERIEGVVPRNAPCACGSGRKFKHCHGRMALESSQPQSFSI